MPNSNPVCRPPNDVNCGVVVLPQILYAQFNDASAPNGACADGTVVPLYFHKDNSGMPLGFRWTTRGHYEEQPDPIFGDCVGEISGTPTRVFVEFFCPINANSADINITIYNEDEIPPPSNCGTGASGVTSSASLDPFEFVYDSVVGSSADCLCCPWPGFDASFNVTVKASL